MPAEKWEVDTFHGVCLRWTVDTNSGDRKYSSEFRFEGGRWKLRYHRYGFFYSLHLCLCSGVSPGRFHVSFHVEISREDGRTMDVLQDEDEFTDEFEQDLFRGDLGHIIWEEDQDVVLRSVPECRLNGILRLVVILKLENPAGTLLSSDASVQTTSYLPCLEGLSEDFSKLLDQGPNPDVEFQCGGKNTRAHSNVVAVRSQVIAKMLAADMVEGRTKIVKIPDMGPDVFEKFLRYLYTGELEGLTFEVALGLFEAGDQYAVTGLANRCSELLVEHLSVQNACEVLAIADAHSDEALVEKVVDYMVEERVPVAFEEWPAFCGQHPMLANKVLNRGWKVLLK